MVFGWHPLPANGAGTFTPIATGSINSRVSSPPDPAVYDVIMFDAIGVETFAPTVDHLAPSA
jgi:hypothetical protein